MFNIDLSRYRIVDLSMEIVPPGTDERPFELVRGLLPDQAFVHTISTNSHVGTHIESPAHFYEGGKDLTGFPLSAFMGRGVLADVHQHRVGKAITAESLAQSLGQAIQRGDIVVICNSDPAARAVSRREDLPCMAPAAAHWLVEHQVKMLAIDIATIRLGQDVPAVREVHDLLLGNDIPILEFPANLESLRKQEFFFMALPLKWGQVDSAPARAIAIEEVD